MSFPYQVGPSLPEKTWRTVKFRSVFDCCKWDVQSEDHCVLADFPLLLTTGTWEELRITAEALTAELTAAELELLDRKDLHSDLGLSQALQREFARFNDPTPGIARVMRFDFHFTDEGWLISEVNADVPGGFIEASGFTQLMSPHYPGVSPPPDPACLYACALASKLPRGATVALVHATAYSDDHQVMQFLAKRMAERGLQAILASPEHIQWRDKRAMIASSFANAPLDAIVRFFPAEWLPSLSRNFQWSPFFSGSHTPMSNPGTAILVQSKRFPLVWDRLSTDLHTWRAVLPQTVCPSAVMDHFGDWVIKPALGRVGEDIAISGVTSDKKLQLIHKAAKRRPSAWIAQRRFTVVPASGANGCYYPCIGVFTIDGIASGAYARLGRKPLIDDEAQDVAVLIADRGTP